MSDIVLKIAEQCPRCLAPWAAVTRVNRELALEQLQQIATPSAKYLCGSVFHPDDYPDFDVPEQEYQSVACSKAELARHRGS